jgi:hypothetical protein
MKPNVARLGAVWGTVQILAGVLLLVEIATDLPALIWAIPFAAGGLIALGFYLSDRADWAMLLSTYIAWAITLLVVLVTLNILRDEAVAFYVLLAIALPFAAVFYRDRRQWWALIPAYVMLVVAVMIGLIGLGVLDDMFVPAYIMLAIALPFFVVYARDRKQWWFLIPGGVLAVVGLSFLISEAAIEYLGALVLILVGVVLLARVFTRKE